MSYQMAECIGCRHRKPIHSYGSTTCVRYMNYACHYLLDTGKQRRKGEDGKCLCFAMCKEA